MVLFNQIIIKNFFMVMSLNHHNYDEENFENSSKNVSSSESDFSDDSLDMTNWSPEDWEKYLNMTEWNIDKEIWIASTSVSRKINSILSLESLFEYIQSIENKNNVRIEIDEDQQWIIIFDIENNNIVWEIKKWNYTYNNLSEENHLFHVVNEPYKWKWFGRTLLEIYWKLEEFNYLGFELPKEEFTHSPSMFNLLTSYWYIVVGKIEDWELEELTDEQIFEIYKNIEENKVEDDNFGVTYKLELRKNL